jgi:hypothetical protein
VLHTLAKGAERGAHRERVRLPPIPPLVRVHPTELLLEEDLDAEGDGRRLRLSLAPVAR